MASSDTFDPNSVNLTTADPAEIICYINAGGNEYNGHMGARISSVFVILICSTLATFFPVVASRVPRMKVPVYVYLFARYFGTGVILATAFVHLLDPAYQEIGPASCVGMTGNWSQYSWPPAIVLASITVIFLMDFGAELYVESKYGVTRGDERTTIVSEHDHPVDQPTKDLPQSLSGKLNYAEESDQDSLTAEKSFRQQIAAFLILEFGVMFHSVIIGLNLGVAGDEFKTLYPVLVFHQSFEGLGIGARMSAIPFKRNSWLPWFLCLAYGLTTLSPSPSAWSMTANIVSGVFDSISAGILIYTSLVELLARDFLFDPCRTNDRRRLGFMIICTLLGTGIMALLGKWA
ncbi:putative high affinity zinc ion transporter [Talaromyces proteolyticus]|uniref:High affinity zinc ion transporter n=1 Tax=Talaromyces proteolyticus TaxID=1131652 RepID=A0AAD4PZF7_9EURO|nr:putative high affinity zinc ion transporter [Talaromyces proteolyticus]KAH8695931.1 putative high affinity zinc ion transporter [Talaromyces proteolyticus]